jgi:hypothetical protein
MRQIATKTRQWIVGSVTTVVLVLLATGCTVHIGYSGTYDESLFGRTPAKFAAACGDIGGSLHQDANQNETVARMSCTAPNGDAIACDWGTERCITTCKSSPDACSDLSLLAYELPRLRQPATSVPASVEGANDGAAHLVTDPLVPFAQQE